MYYKCFGELWEGVWMWLDNFDFDLEFDVVVWVRMLMVCDEVFVDLVGQLWDLLGWIEVGYWLFGDMVVVIDMFG